MNVKRYFAKDMPEAMAQIRNELGPDAVILSSKSIRKSGFAGLFAKPVLEVMVAYENAAKSASGKEKPKPPAERPRQKDAAQKGAVKGLPDATSALERSVSSKPQLLGKVSANAAPGVASTYVAQDPSRRLSIHQPAAPAVSASGKPQSLMSLSATAPRMPDNIPAAAAALDDEFEKWDERENASFKPLSVLAKLPVPDAAKIVMQPPSDKEARQKGAQQTETFSAQKAELFRPPAPQVKPSASFDPTDSNTLKSLDTRIVALDSLISAFSRRMQQFDRSASDYGDDVQELYNRMCSCEVERSLAEALAAETQKIASNRDISGHEVLSQLIKHTLGEPQPIRPLNRARTVVMLMGPTGVGKTTSLVKLAAHFALHENLKVGLINGDTFRITAQEQLKTYADILDVPLDVIYSPDDIVEVLEKQSDRDMVFIDTPGKRPSDERHKEDISRLIELSNPTELHLVLSASTGFASCSEIIRNYGFVPDYRIIATKLDETPSRGLLLNVCHYSGRPLSYLATGQNVPDDIVLASAEEITASIIG